MPKPTTQQSRPSPPIDADALLRWYDKYARILPWRISPQAGRVGAKADPYAVWLSEIMLQQTTVAAVGKYFARFTARWPTVQNLAAAPLDDILVEWAGLGYYARARNLHACANQVVKDHNGIFPKNAAELLNLPGIGPYTAAAIAAICYDEKIAVVDGNVERVVARLHIIDVPVRRAKPAIKASVQQAVPTRAGDFAQAMMDLGATVCAPRKANCPICPLQSGCAAAATERPENYPIKQAKVERPARHGHAFVLVDKKGKVLLRRRPPKGLLAKMTEVPGSPWTNAPQKPAFPTAGAWKRVGQVTHVFTHFRLELDVWRLVGTKPDVEEGSWWAAPDRLQHEALPSLFRKVLGAAGFEKA